MAFKASISSGRSAAGFMPVVYQIQTSNTRRNSPVIHSVAVGGRAAKAFTFRQSRPANSASNCAWFKDISPSLIAGQVKVVSSSRLYVITSPVPSQYKSFNRSARFDRNTNTVPVNGSLRNSFFTKAASPLRPFRESTGLVVTTIRTRFDGKIMIEHSGHGQSQRSVLPGRSHLTGQQHHQRQSKSDCLSLRPRAPHCPLTAR